MVFQEKTYSILLVSSSDTFVVSIQKLLPPTDYHPIVRAESAAQARRFLQERSFDLVLINAPLKDEFGSTLAVDVCQAGSSGVLLFVKNEIYDDVYAKVMAEGVMVIAKPLSAPMVAQTLRMVVSSRERLKKMEKKQATVEEKIKELRLVNRAKWILIEDKGMSEAEAHRYIEKMAMDQRLSKGEVASHILLEV